MPSRYRTEKDSMGEIQVPTDALYQAQTQRAIENFPLSGIPLPTRFIHAVTYIKQAAARTNMDLGLIDNIKGHAIIDSCQSILEGQYCNQFPVDVFQTGSGTSTNMNVNEVIATLASRIAPLAISANDDVNMSQSSNDVIPTAIQVSATLACHQCLIPALEHCKTVIANKIAANQEKVKTGRTHLMDAMPITFAQELEGWFTQLDKAQLGICHSLDTLRGLGQGGTAVGTGINASPEFAINFANNISVSTEIEFHVSDSFFYNISSQDAAVSLSGQLKTTAVALMKISNDLRWMNSGPLAGLADIQLPALQPGSSIMPGKVNPVIPEATAMVAAQVIGNDTTITVAGQSGNFQLNVMLPVIAYNLLQSIELLSNALTTLADKAIAGFTVNDAHIQHSLSKNPILVTALNPIIGYLKAAEIAKKAYREHRDILDVAEEETTLSKEELLALLNPKMLTQGGVIEKK